VATGVSDTPVGRGGAGPHTGGDLPKHDSSPDAVWMATQSARHMPAIARGLDADQTAFLEVARLIVAAGIRPRPTKPPPRP
jgi:hypothetical protein